MSELGTKIKGWAYPSKRWVREAEQFLELDDKLPDVLAGKVTPADSDETLMLAQVAYFHRWYASSTRLFADAFKADPKLAAPVNSHRYNAACAASLAGCGRGEDVAKLTDKERVEIRRQALGWLSDELAGLAKVAAQPLARQQIRDVLRHWQEDTDLAGVRDEVELAKLPAPEQTEWRKLWADVAALQRRVEPTSEKPKVGGRPLELAPLPRQVIR